MADTPDQDTMNRRGGYDFGFRPEACQTCPGNCCRGPSGYVWVNQGEMEALSKYLDLSVIDFMKKYLRQIGNRYSLKENRIGQDYPCIFFCMESLSCSVYPFRPRQCRTFPFWPENLSRKEYLQQECPGITD